MKKEHKEKLEATVRRVQDRTEQFSRLPAVLMDRVLKQTALSILIFVLGVFTGIRLQAWNYVFWSVALGGFCLYKAVRLYRIAAGGNYETVEGDIIKIQGRHRLGRMYKLQILKKDGREVTLLLDKGNKFQKGKPYRFYFSASGHVRSGFQGLDGILNTDAFYGAEEITGRDA